MKNKSKIIALALTVFVLSFLLSGCIKVKIKNECENQDSVLQNADIAFSLADVPNYSGKAYAAINDNIPYFTDKEVTQKCFENYSPLDSLRRCGTCTACIGLDTMPNEKRANISSVKPTAWHSVRYSGIDGGSLYNRCHLIGYQLTAENANEKNLITGTRYMNTEGMLPFENMVSDYVKETGNHVMYRVTPVFDGDNLLASGVLMEGYSVEDKGESILFCVFCYNVQPGIHINYANGDSYEENKEEPSYKEDNVNEQPFSKEDSVAEKNNIKYIINTSSGKFHIPTCSGAANTKENNKVYSRKSREQLIKEGYEPCGGCNP